MRKLIMTIALLFISAYILGQIPGDGVKVMFVAGVASFGAYMVGRQHGYRERVQVQAARLARLELLKG